jgi:hypothetical protein
LVATTEKAKRSIDELIGFVIQHPVRIEALAIFNEGPASPNEISSAEHQRRGVGEAVREGEAQNLRPRLSGNHRGRTRLHTGAQVRLAA